MSRVLVIMTLLLCLNGCSARQLDITDAILDLIIMEDTIDGEDTSTKD
jgi:hypothetical protein